MNTAALRALIPTQITVPAGHTAASITIRLHVDADPVKVVAVGLDEAAVALAPETVALIRQYCDGWSQWLARHSCEVPS